MAVGELVFEKGQGHTLQPFVPKKLNPVHGDWVTNCSMFLRFAARAKNLSPNTVTAYRCDLQDLAGFAESQNVRLVQYVGRQLVEDWMVWLRDVRGNKPVTIRRKLIASREFFEWAVRRALVAENPAADIRVKTTYAVKTAPEMDFLLETIDRMPEGTPMELRDKALMLVLLNAGMRASEPLCLEVYHPARPPECTITPEGLVFFRKKGGVMGQNVLGEKAMRAVNGWLKVRESIAKPGVQALFVTRHGKAMTTRVRVYQLVRALFEQAGVEGIHPHLFKHARVLHVADKTQNNIQAMQAAGNHATPATTMAIYGQRALGHQLSILRSQADL